MARKVLSPQGDGRAIGMYSAGFATQPGRLVFVSGQVAIDGEGRLVGEGDFAAQAGQVFRNLAAVLAAAGCTLKDVVKFGTYLTRAEDFATFTAWRKEHYPRLFPDGVYPPNTGVVVTALARPGLLLEVEAMAVRSTPAARPPVPKRPAARATRPGRARRTPRR
ncbi:MAG TPA: RidA family protein [Methylomirabilota bacterium]|nr:RidA family protein [Methylomirabilota bacterium]